jgi:hypothetical protein
MTGPTHFGIRSSFSVLLVYLRPFFSLLFFLKFERDLSFPGMRCWGRGCGCLLDVDKVLVAKDSFLEEEDEAFEGDDMAFARLRAAEVVSVRSKYAYSFV